MIPQCLISTLRPVGLIQAPPKSQRNSQQSQHQPDLTTDSTDFSSLQTSPLLVNTVDPEDWVRYSNSCGALRCGCRRVTFKSVLFFSPRLQKGAFQALYITIPQYFVPGKRWWPFPKGTRKDCGTWSWALAAPSNTGCVCSNVHAHCFVKMQYLQLAEGILWGSFQNTEEEVTSCCCAKAKGSSSVPGTYHQAFASRLPWRLLRGEKDFFDVDIHLV